MADSVTEAQSYDEGRAGVAPAIFNCPGQKVGVVRNVVTLWTTTTVTAIAILLVFSNMLSIILIAVFCLCVCVIAISKISGIGGDSTTLLAPTWRASLGSIVKKLVVFLVQYLINWSSS